MEAYVDTESIRINICDSRNNGKKENGSLITKWIDGWDCLLTLATSAAVKSSGTGGDGGHHGRWLGTQTWRPGVACGGSGAGWDEISAVKK